MKRLLIILFIIISIKSFGQLPNTLPQGSEGLEWWQRGITGADLGIRWRMSFADTTAANNYKGGILKNISGFTIRTVDSYWARSNDLTKWNLINGTVTAVTNFFRNPGIDSLYFIINGVTYAIKDSIGTGGGGGSDSVAVLNTVTQISSLSRIDVNQLVVTDTIRGGNFNLYAGSDAADGGMIFEDGVGRKWIRQWNKIDPINVQWFGFVPDGVTDNYANFVALKTWLINHRAKSDPSNPSYNYFGRLHPIFFPAAFDYYKFSQTLNFEYACTILGAPNYSSKLLFPADSVGIALWFVDQYSTGTSSDDNLIKDLYIRASLDGSYDTTAHGIKVKAPSNFYHVQVVDFGGSGFDFNSTDPSNSNVDFCIIDNCKATGNLDGMNVRGGEANVLRIYNGDYSINRRWGVNDNGFLGNFYYAVHTAVNGVVTSGQKTFVIHRTGGIGIRYQYAAKYDGFLTMPGDSADWEDDWVLIGDSTVFYNGNAPDYVAGTYYWQGGSYHLETGTLLNCYDEGGQMGRRLGQFGTSLFGIHGAATNGDQGFQWNSIGVFQSSYGKKMNLTLPGSGYAVGVIGAEYSDLTNTDLTFYKTSGQGLRIRYDTTSNFGQFVDLGTGTSRTYLTSAAATPATYGRTSFLDGVLYNIGGSYIGSFDDSKANLIVYGTTVPASGTWSQGDLVIKRNVSASDAYGWRCTVGGTPGTWETLTFGGGSGVTSVAAGYGMAFTTITTTGSVIVDTFVMATRAQLNHKLDSVIAAFAGVSLSGTNTWTAQNTFARNAVIGSTSTPDATSPLTVDAASTNTAYLLQMGKNGNPAYFRVDKDGNITDIGGGAAPITSAGGKPYFPSGFAATTWASAANGNSVLRSDWSGTFPWIFYNAASTTDNQIGLIVTGNNATTKGDIQQWADKDFNILSVVNKDGKFGAGVSSPTAYLHPKAGTATAGTAPIKLNTGTALTTPEDGAIEYHGSHIYFTIGSTRYQLDQQAGTNLGNSDLTQATADAIREYNLGYFNATGNRYLALGKLNGTEKTNITISSNSSTHSGYALIQASDSTSGVAVSGFYNPNGGTILQGISISGGKGNRLTQYLDSSTLNFHTTSYLTPEKVYKFTKDSLLIKGNMGVSASSSDSVLVRGSDNVVVLRAQSDLGGGLLSETYTPTLTNVANVAASTAYSCQYSRVGTVVTVSGEVDIDPTTTITLTQLGISLPIASNLAATNELGGTSADDLGTVARVAADFTNDRAEVRMTPTDVTNRRFSFTFTYRIL